ncbi:hypothetical protein KQX54_006483 [Cotesia glomerata]|uniref:Uncharacterized protein n=1 Tax=Cotesia glomerata TaxID=32391 RepID=A0AAV7I9T7_COTGL|nr:hypothetical protein KQX54_006483 [Cotesia glomerata]
MTARETRSTMCIKERRIEVMRHHILAENIILTTRDDLRRDRGSGPEKVDDEPGTRVSSLRYLSYLFPLAIIWSPSQLLSRISNYFDNSRPVSPIYSVLVYLLSSKSNLKGRKAENDIIDKPTITFLNSPSATKEPLANSLEPFLFVSNSCVVKECNKFFVLNDTVTSITKQASIIQLSCNRRVARNYGSRNVRES